MLPRLFLTFEVYNNVSSTKSHTTKVQKPLLKGNFLLVHSPPPLKGEVPPQRRRGCPTSYGCNASNKIKKFEFTNRTYVIIALLIKKKQSAQRQKNRRWADRFDVS